MYYVREINGLCISEHVGGCLTVKRYGFMHKHNGLKQDVSGIANQIG